MALNVRFDSAPLQTLGPQGYVRTPGSLSLSCQFILCFHGAYSITKLICNQLPQANCNMVNLDPLPPHCTKDQISWIQPGGLSCLS